jgi:hypothetical protein
VAAADYIGRRGRTVKNLPHRARLLNVLYDRRRILERQLRVVDLTTPLAHIRAWKREHASIVRRIEQLERGLM